MIYLTQLIYIQSGKDESFNAFEDVAIPAIKRHNGVLMLRIRPSKDNFIECNVEQPYEIHMVSFPSEADFQLFLNDKERKSVLHLKEDSIKEMLLIKGERL